jgi:GTP-binding protein
VTGKVESGQVSIGDRIKVLNREGEQQALESKVTKLFYLEGLKRVDVEHAYAGQNYLFYFFSLFYFSFHVEGEIISMAGCEGGVADTVCSIDRTDPIKTIPLSPPVISMTFGPNDSPLSGTNRLFNYTLLKNYYYL